MARPRHSRDDAGFADIGEITRMPCSWRQCITLFTEELPWLKGKDLELVMGRALRDWIGCKLP